MVTPDPEPPTPAPLTVHEKFQNLTDVSDFISLPAWLATHEEKLSNRLFVTTADASMPDGTVLSAAEATAARLEVAEMRRQIKRIRRDHSDDPEAAIGQARELIETVCETILGVGVGVGGGDEGATWNFPKLVKQTLPHLGIEPSQQHNGDAVQVRAAQRWSAASRRSSPGRGCCRRHGGGGSGASTSS